MIELLFITSNRAKLDHSKYLCRNTNINISKQKQYGVGYIEPRITNRELLLEESIIDAIKRLRKVSPSNPKSSLNTIDEKFVFIEDTSVIIEALSTDNNEVPGVDIKYWMKEITFEKLDNSLKSKNNNRNVIVRSDMLLFLPRIIQERLQKKYLRFTSQVSGTIVTVDSPIRTQPLYPWLNNGTFNKWFVPKGYKLPLSALDIKDADAVDFRKGAFDKMISFLVENRFARIKVVGKQNYKQTNLFNQALFIICGNTCAGKTSISDFLFRKFGYYHIEASDFMYLSYYEKHGLGSDVKIGDFAAKALYDNPSIVVEQIIKHINNLKGSKKLPLVISGFRSPDEIKKFRQEYIGVLDIEVVYIKAGIKTRFQRSLDRERGDKVKTISEFRNRDTQQNKMGLSLILKNINKDSIINNNHTLDDFYSSFEERFDESFELLSPKKKGNNYKSKKYSSTNLKLEDAILIVLRESNQDFLTTTEIAHKINDRFSLSHPKEKDNVSRYFNMKYYPFYDILFVNGKTKYKLSQTGISYSEIVKMKYSE